MGTLFKWIMVGSLASFPTLCYAQNDGWAAVQALPSETRVRIQERDGRGGEVEGSLLMVEESLLTLLTRGRPIVIPKASIGRIEQLRRDSAWEGLIIGALWGVVARATYAAEACSRTPEPQCTLQIIGVRAGLGAFIDYQIRGSRTVYRSSRPAMTLMKFSF